MSENKLLPCPFCGGNAEIKRGGNVICIECKCMKTDFNWSDDEDSLIKKWNSRSSQPRKITSCKCSRHPDSAFTATQLDEGLLQCPRCGGIIVGQTRKMEIDEEICVRNMLHKGYHCACNSCIEERSNPSVCIKCGGKLEIMRDMPHDKPFYMPHDHSKDMSMKDVQDLVIEANERPSGASCTELIYQFYKRFSTAANVKYIKVINELGDIILKMPDSSFMVNGDVKTSHQLARDSVKALNR